MILNTSLPYCRSTSPRQFLQDSQMDWSSKSRCNSRQKEEHGRRRASYHFFKLYWNTSNTTTLLKYQQHNNWLASLKHNSLAGSQARRSVTFWRSLPRWQHKSRLSLMSGCNWLRTHLRTASTMTLYQSFSSLVTWRYLTDSPAFYLQSSPTFLWSTPTAVVSIQRKAKKNGSALRSRCHARHFAAISVYSIVLHSLVKTLVRDPNLCFPPKTHVSLQTLPWIHMFLQHFSFRDFARCSDDRAKPSVMQAAHSSVVLHVAKSCCL